MKYQSENERYMNFHGLRDFYSMIKYISPRIKPGKDIENEIAIIDGIKRNFGGANYIDSVAKTLQETLDIKDIGNLRVLQPDQLIRSNIQEANPNTTDPDVINFKKLYTESRHLLIITDN